MKDDLDVYIDVIKHQQQTIKKLVDTLNLFLHDDPSAMRAGKEIVKWMVDRG
jgi:hypothetical protein